MHRLQDAGRNPREAARLSADPPAKLDPAPRSGAARAPAPVYRGRFAPSPTGPLHFGSLITALASFADARAQGGEWLVRIEDLDRPREVPGAAARILDSLRALGMDWDREVLRQSERAALYEGELERLVAAGLTYPCACSRAEIARAGRPGPEGPIYPGTCRGGLPAGRPARTLRLRADAPPIEFDDRIQGHVAERVAETVGDYVLRRADGIHAYQLAVVVDDARQGINQVVRGADLLASTPRQILLQRHLGLASPTYAHVPLALGPDGRKLSKSLASTPVDAADPLPALLRAWAFLGQLPPPKRPTLAAFWSHAIRHWAIERTPARRSIPVS